MPNDNAVNNTHSLMFHTDTSNMSTIGKTIARENSLDVWRKRVTSSKAMRDMNDALLSYARKLLKEDKMRMLSEHSIPVNIFTDEDELNINFVELLISTLPETEINKLVSENLKMRQSLINDLSNAENVVSIKRQTVERHLRSNQEDAGSIGRQAQTLGKVIEETAETSEKRDNVRSARKRTEEVNFTPILKDELKKLKTLQSLCKIDMHGKRLIKIIRKELVLLFNSGTVKEDKYHTYNMIELSSLAQQMGVNTDDYIVLKRADLEKLLVEHVILYLSQVIGSGDKYFTGFIKDVGVYESVLKQLPSYNLIVDGFEKNASKEKSIRDRQSALLSKKSTQREMSRFSIDKETEDVYGASGLFKSKVLRGMNTIAPKFRIGSRYDSIDGESISPNEYDIPAVIDHMLQNPTTPEIKELVDNNLSKTDVSNISEEITEKISQLGYTDEINEWIKHESHVKGHGIEKLAQSMGEELSLPEYDVLLTELNKVYAKKNKSETISQNILSTLQNIDTQSANYKPQQISFTPRDKSINQEDISLLNTVIEIRDYTSGIYKASIQTSDQGTDGYVKSPLIRYDNNDFKKIKKDTNRIEYHIREKALKKYGGDFDALSEDDQNKARGEITSNINKYRMSRSQYERRGKTVSGSLDFIEPRLYKRGINKINLSNASPVLIVNREREIDTVKAPSGSVDSFLTKKGMDDIRLTSAAPVYVMNKDGSGDAITKQLASINSFLNKSLPLLLSTFVTVGPMSSGVTTNPTALILAGKGALDNAADMVVAAMDSANAPIAHATGGSGKFMGGMKTHSLSETSAIPHFSTGGLGQTSQFISGDSLDGMENKEKVSIDWSNNSYRVKPIPYMDEHGPQESTKISNMSKSERESPMAVSLTGPLSRYRNATQNIESDDGDMAVKVINVSPSFYDPSPDHNNISAMDVLLTIQTILTNIETVSETDLELQKLQLSGLQNIGNNNMLVNGSSPSSPGSNVSPRTSGGFTRSLDGILVGA